MIIITILTFVILVWLINKLLFGSLFDTTSNDTARNIQDNYQQQQQFQQYQQFQQREQERFSRNNDGPVTIEKADQITRKPARRTIGDYGEYVDFKEVEN